MKYLFITAMIFAFAVSSCTKEEDVLEIETTVEEFDFSMEVETRSVLNSKAVAYVCQDGLSGADVIVVSNIEDFELFNAGSWVDTDKMVEGDFFLINSTVATAELTFFYALVDLGNGPELVVVDQTTETDLVFEEASQTRVAGSISGTIIPINGEEIQNEFKATFDTDEIGECQ